jgi:hypothetical protein
VPFMLLLWITVGVPASSMLTGLTAGSPALWRQGAYLPSPTVLSSRQEAALRASN